MVLQMTDKVREYNFSKSMAKYLVETFYNCTFKVSHYLDDINENELQKIEKRDDGKFEILDVKLDNRKTKNLDPKNQKINSTETVVDTPKVKNVSKDRYRLSVSRSTKNISAQIIDDVKNITLVSASSIDKEIKVQKKKTKFCSKK